MLPCECRYTDGWVACTLLVLAVTDVARRHPFHDLVKMPRRNAPPEIPETRNTSLAAEAFNVDTMLSLINGA